MSVLPDLNGTAKGTLVMPDELPEPADIQGEDVPPVREYLTAKQKTAGTYVRKRFLRKHGDGSRHAAVKC